MNNPIPNELVRANSPALRVFETNPFRCFRLPVTASTTQAASTAENALTLARLNIAPDEPDPAPWLPAPSTFQLQQAAQDVEEPYVRLRAQLLWFDFERDPHGADLREALCNPVGDALQRYLATDPRRPPPLSPSLPPEEGLPWDPASTAQRINHANLCLLLASAANSGALPLTIRPEREVASFPRKAWRESGDFRILASPQNLLNGAGGAEGIKAGGEWRSGLDRWEMLFADPDFRKYLEICIAQLDDDFIKTDDAEAVQESVRVFLADLSAQEVRHLLLDGNYPLATAQISAAANSGMDFQVLRPAMRSLTQVFQAELSELDPLLDHARGDGLAGAIDFINRLQTVRERWQEIDQAGLLGLLDLLDESVEKAFVYIRRIEKNAPNLKETLERLAGLASAESLRERIKSYQTEVVEDRKRYCHFCQAQRPDYKKSVVLRGTKETGRTRQGNTTVIHYSTRWSIVLRCGSCARFHDFMTTAAIIQALLVLLLAIAAFFMLIASGDS